MTKVLVKLPHKLSNNMLKRALFLIAALGSLYVGNTLAHGDSALEHSTIHITRSLNYDAQKANINQKLSTPLFVYFHGKLILTRT